MKQRVITGIIFGIVVLALLLFHDIGRLILIIAIPLLSVIEYSQMTKFKILDWFVLIALSAITNFVVTNFPEYTFYFLITSVLTNLFLLVNLLSRSTFVKHQMFKSVIANFYITSPFILAYHFQLHSQFQILLISIMILIWVSDSSAYFVGSQIGKRKLFPEISPKKTWEGFYGAGMCVFIFAYVIFSIGNYKQLSFWIFFALIIWILGAIGDLIASHVKRLHSIKDSGTILPGHGGFYDRFDAFIFVLPFVLFLHKYWLG